MISPRRVVRGRRQAGKAGKGEWTEEGTGEIEAKLKRQVGAFTQAHDGVESSRSDAELRKGGRVDEGIARLPEVLKV